MAVQSNYELSEMSAVYVRRGAWDNDGFLQQKLQEDEEEGAKPTKDL